jgi:hypothetical protein
MWTAGVEEVAAVEDMTRVEVMTGDKGRENDVRKVASEPQHAHPRQKRPAYLLQEAA